MNWRGFLARYDVYQRFNYLMHKYIKKPRTEHQYKRLAVGGYLTEKQAQ